LAFGIAAPFSGCIKAKPGYKAPMAIGLSNKSIAENGATNAIIGRLSAFDLDPNETFTYSLVTGSGSADNAAFVIVGSDLVIKSAANYEVKSSYFVRIRSTDSHGLSTEQAFTISITNVNEAPTAITLSANSVAEGTASGTSVGTLSTTDPDSGSKFTYSLVTGTGSTDNLRFTISGNALQLGFVPDFETKASYSVRVRSTDAGGLYTEQSFTISITNVNEAPTDLTYQSMSPVYTTGSEISENAPRSSGGAIVSYSINPALPAGLLISTSTGVISGTPTATKYPAGVYTVTAANADGSTSATLTITVNSTAPTIAATNSSGQSVSTQLSLSVVGSNFSKITAGGHHTCRITTTGSAYCWGYGVYGELGDGSTTNRSTPVAVSGQHTFTQIAAGYFHTCGITTTGSTYCWGYNVYGALGDGSTTDRSTPVAVSGQHTFTQIAAGQLHTCGITTTGSAYCWGYGGYGALGNGWATRYTPVAVSGQLTFTQIAAGVYHTCGITTTGSAYCWGYNDYGQLGDGSGTSRSTPVAVSGQHTFTQIAPGYFHTCGTTTTGSTYCWGDNSSGQLGDGSGTSSSTPVAISGQHTFTQIAAGGYHTCGITTAGSTHCWGQGDNGALGDGSTATGYTPVAVSGQLTFTQIAAGFYHTCGTTTAGSTYCWGYNDYGALGDGSNTTRTTPVPVN
jgi:alpha-tubulin suppressor-like RCC1 family protein